MPFEKSYHSMLTNWLFCETPRNTKTQKCKYVYNDPISFWFALKQVFSFYFFFLFLHFPVVYLTSDYNIFIYFSLDTKNLPHYSHQAQLLQVQQKLPPVVK